MTAKNYSGTISMTGFHHSNGQRRYQITVYGSTMVYNKETDKGVSYIDVDAETIANMQRCVDEYRELYPDSED